MYSIKHILRSRRTHTHTQTPGDGGDDQDDWGFTPTSRLPDKERFRDVELLKMTCRACRQEAEFRGVFSWDRTKPVNGPGDVQVRIFYSSETEFV